MDNREKKTHKKYKVNNELYSEDDFLKDCPNSQFIPTVLPAVSRIIAIGDIHGDLDLAIKSFKLANLIDDDFNWIANPPDTVVVQVGDQIDSCRPIPGVYDCHTKKYPDDKAEDMTIIKFFDDMHKKAFAAGGAVYSLFGNHELMNSQGRFGYVSYDNFYNFKYESEDGTMYEGPNGRKAAFKPGGPVATMLACSRISVLIVGSTMFVHAGVLPILAKKLDHLHLDSETKLKYLNAIVRKWLLRKLSEKDKENKSLFLDDGELSPFWTRIYGIIPENVKLDTNECFNSVKKTIEVFKIGHIVVGHTPQLFTNKNGINGTCYEKSGENKLYRVDGGFSKAFKIFDNQNLIQILEIIDDSIFNIITDTNIPTSIDIPGTLVTETTKEPDININETQMRKIASIYSQNRTTSERSKSRLLRSKKSKKLSANKKLIY